MNQTEKTKAMINIAMFAAVLAVCAQIAIPTPWGVPVTMQTFAFALTGCILGSRKGAVSVLIYLALGAIGIPVFAEFRGGMGILVGMTGGFLISAPVMAVLCGIGGRQKNMWYGIIWNLLGMAVCHLIGIMQFSLVTGYSFAESAMFASVPYLVKDVIVVSGAYLIARSMMPRLRSARVL